MLSAVNNFFNLKILFTGNFEALRFLTPGAAAHPPPCSYVSGHRDDRTLRMCTNLHLRLHHEIH
jgi:hypothetical protein